MSTLNQRSFSGGEISPFLYSRVDVSKYITGLRTCRNFMVLRHGGASNRPGSQFVCEVKDSSKATRLIEFIFNTDQTFVLEFGDLYIRFIKNGTQVRLTTKTITGITNANPAVVTSNSHGYSNGDEVYITGVSGMSQVNNRNFKITVLSADTFSLQEMDSTTNINSTNYTTYVSGGTSAKVYELATTYTEDELFEINFVQSADVVTLVHPSHRPVELARTSDTNWALNEIDFLPETDYPSGIAASVGSAGAVVHKYKVTAINKDDGEESLPGLDNNSNLNITAITKANPAVVTSNSHGLSNGDEIMIRTVGGMTELNQSIFTVANVATNTFELEGIDSTNFTTYTSGGTIRRVFATVTAAAPTASTPNVISWNTVVTAREFNVYKATNGVYGLIGIAIGTSFRDIGQTPDTSITPPNSINLFVGADNYPSAVTYIQQRLAFANTNNDTEKIWLSRIGNYKNFTTSSPLQADDSIAFNMAGNQINAVKHMLDIRGFVVLTTGGEWRVSGSGGGPITPTTLDPQQQSYNGSGDLRPLIVSGAAIFQQARGSIVRDLGFDFEVDGYTGNDLTIFSSHLFDQYELVDWAYQKIPHSIVWAARDDGTLLGMTYVREQQIIAWHHHDFQDGSVESVCSIPEGNEDGVYLVVNRTINGLTKRYIEKFSTRQVIDIVDVKIMDSHLSYDGRNTNESHTMTLSGGTTWAYDETITLTSSAAFFTASDVGNSITLYGTSGEIIRFSINAFSSSTVVTGKPNKTVPASMRSAALNSWDRAVDQLSGLWHLEGEDVSVFADGFVVASPNNESYDTVTVTNGSITLDRPYGVIHVGLPITSDIETLDIDTSSSESLINKNKNVDSVNLYVAQSRGIWAGPKPPTDDDVDPLEGLREYKARMNEGYDEPVDMKTDPILIIIDGEWNNNGRVFIRQVDPVPLTILSVAPSGHIPFRR